MPGLESKAPTGLRASLILMSVPSIRTQGLGRGAAQAAVSFSLQVTEGCTPSAFFSSWLLLLASKVQPKQSKKQVRAMGALLGQFMPVQRTNHFVLMKSSFLLLCLWARMNPAFSSRESMNITAQLGRLGSSPSGDQETRQDFLCSFSTLQL